MQIEKINIYSATRGLQGRSRQWEEKYINTKKIAKERNTDKLCRDDFELKVSKKISYIIKIIKSANSSVFGVCPNSNSLTFQ